MGLVVRCPSCRGASMVDADARGHTVQCPRCEDTFIAVPEAEVVASGRPARNPTSPRNPTLPISTRRRLEQESPSYPASDEVPKSPDHDHDPQAHSRGPLPASVLLGFALLPFGIPIIWLIATPLFGQPPLASIAVPIALAVSASILSLAVIYTIDWSPAIRIKGVLMLLALAYFTAVSLYFLNKDIVLWFKAHFGEWPTFTETEFGYSVKMPEPPTADNQCQPIPKIQLKCHTLSHKVDAVDQFSFVVGADTTPNGAKGPKSVTNHQWLKMTAESIIAATQGELDPNQEKQNETDLSGNDYRQFGIKLGEDKTKTRIVRLVVVNNRLFYLSLEGTHLSWEDEIARRFFDSFKVANKLDVRKK
jgi:hypothetical protein